MLAQTLGLVVVDLVLLWVGGFVAVVGLVLVGILGAELGGAWRPIAWASWITAALFAAFLVAVTIAVFGFGWR